MTLARQRYWSRRLERSLIQPTSTFSARIVAVPINGVSSTAVSPIINLVDFILNGVLPPPSSNSDQYSCAYGDRERGQGAMLNLCGNPLQRIVADSGADPDCLIA
jgi:hypothetical protein